MLDELIPSLQDQYANIPASLQSNFLNSVVKKTPVEWSRLWKLFSFSNGGNVDSNGNVDLWQSPQCFSAKTLPAELFASLKREGAAYFQRGEVAMLTVAGGLGTRLRYNAPKGLLPITHIKGKSLFQVFAEKLEALKKRYGHPIHWLIMTSEETDAATRTAFKEHAWYDPQYVHFFKQGIFPAFNDEGHCLLDKNGNVRYYPDGHGGVFKALERAGLIADLKTWGIKFIHYFQVDNPLIVPGDTLFLGLHIQQNSAFSTKIVSKRAPAERVGVFIEVDQRIRLVEYSEFPTNKLDEQEPSGILKFRHGNTGIHILSVDFIEKCATLALPIHKIHKPIETWDFTLDQETTSMAFKFEQFIFDALPYANKAILLEIDRAEEFSPIKNETGEDSLATCLRDQQNRWKRWIAKAARFHEKNLDLEAINLENIPVEISPTFADSWDEFSEKWRSLEKLPDLSKGLFLS